jgi:CheY-like chemotaxis protein
MSTPMSNGVSSGGGDPPLSSAEKDVAAYFREGAEPPAVEETKGLLATMLGWLAPVTEGGEGGAAPVRKSVLLVDDEPDGVEALVRMFEKCGYAARSVDSAEKALAAIKAEPPAVVLVDIMMPGMDGVALLKAIRADPASAKLPVLMLTANHRRMLESFTSGAQDYLLKPVDFPKVRESVERHLKDGGVH